MNRVSITGNTYPVKDQLKALGGRWNPTNKSWDVPENKSEEARALVRSATRETVREVKVNTQPAQILAPKRRPLMKERGGVCRACGDDCGGSPWSCGYGFGGDY